MRNWKAGVLALTWTLIWVLGTSGGSGAAELRAEMHRATPSGPGEAVGTITIADSAQGAVVKTDLTGLPPGPHGFHVHENGSCQPATAEGQTVPAGAAGGGFCPPPTPENPRAGGGRPPPR